MNRTLPLRVDPSPGEGLDSWLEALALRHDATLGDICAVIGLITRDPRPWWIVRLEDRQLETLSRTTGIAADALQRMTLEHYDGTALAIDVTRKRFDHRFPYGCRSWSRYCPQCLRESGGRWMLHWRFGWVFACTRHRCLLADGCPSCRHRQRRSVRRLSLVPRPMQCGGTTHCQQDLTTADVAMLDEGHPVLEAQRLLLQIIADDHADFGVYAEQPTSAREALRDIRSLTSRILNQAATNGWSAVLPSQLLTPELADCREVESRQRRDTAQANAPGVAAQAAPAITAALDVLRAPTPQKAAYRARVLYTGMTPNGVNAAVDTNARDTAVVAPILLKAAAPHGGSSIAGPITELRYRTASTNPSIPVAVGRRARRVVHGIPALLWPEWALRLYTGDRHYDTTRFLYSCATLLVGDRLPLAEANVMLGEMIQSSGLLHKIRVLQDDPSWETVCTALTRLNEYLWDYLCENPAPIDYVRRRRISYTGLLSDQRWAQICRLTGALPGKGEHIKALIARGYLYQKISGNAARVMLAGHTATPRELEQHASRVRRFPGRLTAEIAELLDGEAHRFLQSQHIDEPLTWSAPVDLINDIDGLQPDPRAIDIPALHRACAAGTQHLPRLAAQLDTNTHVVAFLLGQHPVHSRQRERVEIRRREVFTCLTSATLRELYIDQGLTLAEIGKRYNTSRFTVRRLLDADAIPVRNRNPPPTPEWLYEQHIVKRRTLSDIAAETGVKEGAVSAWLRDLRRSSLGEHPATDAESMDRARARHVLQPAQRLRDPTKFVRNFVDALRYDSLTEAAAPMHLTQSGLCWQIRQLEAAFGAPLLQRARHGLPLRPTLLGTEVVTAYRALSAESIGGEESATRHSTGTSRASARSNNRS